MDARSGESNIIQADAMASAVRERFRGEGGGLSNIAMATMDAMASPLWLVYDDGQLLFANDAAQRCLTGGSWLEERQGRLNTSLHHDCAPPLRFALERLKLNTGSALLLTNQITGRQAVVAVAPLVSDSGDMTASRLGLISLTTSDPGVTPIRRLALTFNLTRAEQQLLAQLAAGTNLREAASLLNRSIHTVRNQMKSVLNKTGWRSQAQLLTLVARMGLLRLPEQD